jgi:hypothetical protein
MYSRIYTGDDGKSHFEEMQPPQGPIKIDTTRGVRFSRMEPHYFYDYHVAPRRTYLITLSGYIDQGTGDGTVRRFGPGDVMLEDDLTGQGHTTRIGDEPRLYVSIPLAE